MLPEARLFVCLVDPDTTGVLQPACNCQGRGIPLRRSASLSADYRAKANALWQNLIAGSDEALWASLAAALCGGQGGSSLYNVKSGDDHDPGRSADIAPDVFEYPRGDAALLYGLQRAREVLRAIKGQLAECRDPETAQSTGFMETGAVDQYGDLSANDQVKKPPWHRLYAHYMFLTSNLGRADYSEGACDPVGGHDPLRVWTMAKFRMPHDGPLAQAGHFWPCTREEVDIRLSLGKDGDTTGTAVRDSCAVFQYDGVVDLGVTYCQNDGTKNPRYDIVSIDTIQVVQSDIQSDRRLQQRANANPGSRSASNDLGAQTHRTGGLAVLDRWRQDHVVSQITTAQLQIAAAQAATGQQRAIVLDAEDMTTGYRLDVGIDVGTHQETQFVWRCLMNRKMQFHTLNSSDDWLEKGISALYRRDAFYPVESPVERRRRADSASLSIASRMRQNDPRAGGASQTVFAEQIMIAWQGDPLGLDCIDPQGVTSLNSSRQQTVTEQKNGLSMVTEDLPLDLRYELETSADREAYRPPSLRYGWPYHFGLRPVYLGGVILPIELAISRYQVSFNTGSALPSPGKQAGRRFLRQERIEAPLLTLPDNVAASTANLNAEDIKKDPARRDTGATCILRTSLVDKDIKLGLQSTVRILFPPIMQLDQAALNGVFDDDRVEEVTLPLRDGTGKLLKDKKGGLLTRKLQRPPDGLKQLDFSGDRQTGVDQPRGGFPHYIYPNSPAGEDRRGPAVFRLGGKTPREIPFYPDPSATSYVIKVRRPRGEDYLDGSIIIPAYSAEVKYPNVLPLAIEIQKIGPRSKPATSISDLFKNDCCEIAYADKAGVVRGPHGGGLPVRHAVAQLAQGEDFEIEVWCIPSAEEFRRKFDIVESIAILLMRDSAAEQLAEGMLDQACIDSLRNYFPDLPAAVEALRNSGKYNNPLCGPGGMSLPQPAVMDEVAKRIVAVLCNRPIPELAATTRIHVVHAVDQPLAAPAFLNGAEPSQAVRIVRTQ